MLFYDLESTDLAASFGRILCASFATLDEDPYTFRGDRKPYVGKTKIDDSRLVKAVRDELEGADMIVGWNSKLFDGPMINARLAKAGERPLMLGEKHGVRHLDLMWYSGGQSMRIGSKRLDNVQKFFGSDHAKTPLDPETWALAATGDRPSMDGVVEHCESDVLVLRDLWPHLASHVKQFQFSLSEVWPFIGEIPSRKVAA